MGGLFKLWSSVDGLCHYLDDYNPFSQVSLSPLYSRYLTLSVTLVDEVKSPKRRRRARGGWEDTDKHETFHYKQHSSCSCDFLIERCAL
jgi:hypothetical protein